MTKVRCYFYAIGFCGRTLRIGISISVSYTHLTLPTNDSV